MFRRERKLLRVGYAADVDLDVEIVWPSNGNDLMGGVVHAIGGSVGLGGVVFFFFGESGGFLN